MRDQPALAVDDEGLTVRADLDLRHHVPDEFEIDLGHRHAGILARAGQRNGHVRFALAPEIDRAVIDLVRHRLREARIVRIIGAGADHIHLEPRDAKLLLAGRVELGQLGDRRHLAQQAQRVEAALVERRPRPWQLGGPADLVLDLGDELSDLCRGGGGLFALDADQRRFVVLVGKPDREGAIGEQRDAHHGDEQRHVFAEKPAAHGGLRRRCAPRDRCDPMAGSVVQTPPCRRAAWSSGRAGGGYSITGAGLAEDGSARPAAAAGPSVCDLALCSIDMKKISRTAPPITKAIAIAASRPR